MCEEQIPVVDGSAVASARSVTGGTIGDVLAAGHARKLMASIALVVVYCGLVVLLLLRAPGKLGHAAGGALEVGSGLSWLAVGTALAAVGFSIAAALCVSMSVRIAKWRLHNRMAEGIKVKDLHVALITLSTMGTVGGVINGLQLCQGGWGARYVLYVCGVILALWPAVMQGSAGYSAGAQMWSYEYHGHMPEPATVAGWRRPSIGEPIALGQAMYANAFSEVAKDLRTRYGTNKEVVGKGFVLNIPRMQALVDSASAGMQVGSHFRVDLEASKVGGMVLSTECEHSNSSVPEYFNLALADRYSIGFFSLAGVAAMLGRGASLYVVSHQEVHKCKVQVDYVRTRVVGRAGAPEPSGSAVDVIEYSVEQNDKMKEVMSEMIGISLNPMYTWIHSEVTILGVLNSWKGICPTADIGKCVGPLLAGVVQWKFWQAPRSAYSEHVTCRIKGVPDQGRLAVLVTFSVGLVLAMLTVLITVASTWRGRSEYQNSVTIWKDFSFLGGLTARSLFTSGCGMRDAEVVELYGEEEIRTSDVGFGPVGHLMVEAQPYSGVPIGKGADIIDGCQAPGQILLQELSTAAKHMCQVQPGSHVLVADGKAYGIAELTTIFTEQRVRTRIAVELHWLAL